MKDRDVQPEVMDQPGLSEELHRTALAALGRINLISRTESNVWLPIQKLAERSHSPLRVLDLACGGGDVLRSLARRARKAGLTVQFSGCDVSSLAVAYAREKTRQQGLCEIEFFEHNVLSAPLPEGYDVILSTLFLHHLQTVEAEQLLRATAAAARRMVLIDDLRRTRTGYLLARFGTQFLTRSPIVHVDGPLSVRAALSLRELKGMADRCGMRNANIQAHWPQRMLLSWERTE